MTHLVETDPLGDNTRDLAGDTPLHPHGDPVDLHVAVERRSEVIVPVFVRTGPWYHLLN